MIDPRDGAEQIRRGALAALRHGLTAGPGGGLLSVPGGQTGRRGPSPSTGTPCSR